MTAAPDPLHGRISVITGGAGAIGTAITRALHGTGHRTVVLDRDAEIACGLGSEASTRARGRGARPLRALRLCSLCLTATRMRQPPA
jgi:NAD(P)-dependent dehydrogenase (short-subunit alcohol dehydrogenase family)